MKYKCTLCGHEVENFNGRLNNVPEQNIMCEDCDLTTPFLGLCRVIAPCKTLEGGDN